MHATPGWYRDPDGILRWWDGTAWREAARAGAAAVDDTPAIRAGRAAPSTRTAARGSWIGDWFVQWTLLVGVLTVVGAVGLQVVAGRPLTPTTLLTTAAWLPVAVALFVLPAGCARVLAALVRSRRRGSALVLNDRVTLSDR